ncbi:MAG: threonylcarbamoyl-AMP synthase [Euryarchaeota archaeon]|nr:threonylcarbamoyl-AMP synthase [Euryarchaeota archaeon]
MRTVRAIMIEGQAVLDVYALEDIVAVLRNGGLIVFPTDTLYGLGADPYRPEAVTKLFAAKQRPEGLPVSVVVASVDAAKEFAVIPPHAESFCRQWLPGPLTLVFRPTERAPRAIVSAQNTVAIRVPNHPVALLLAKQFGPLTATSANVHGKPPPVEAWEAQEQLGDSVDLYVDAGPCPVGRESTVVDSTGPEPRVIREGAVSAERLGLERRRD